ncbi:MAG: hypothetical protein IJ175_07800 [Clostridia bacterium]|nr:hypothetical protein [Clostridia bacterium]
MISMKMGAPQIIMTVLILAKCFQLTEKDRTLADSLGTVVAVIAEVALLKWGGFY